MEFKLKGEFIPTFKNRGSKASDEVGIPPQKARTTGISGFSPRGFIELDNMLKVLELVASAAEAKQCIQSGSVKVNGQVETRVRRKLRAGDVVEFSLQQIHVV